MQGGKSYQKWKKKKKSAQTDMEWKFDHTELYEALELHYRVVKIDFWL